MFGAGGMTTRLPPEPSFRPTMIDTLEHRRLLAFTSSVSSGTLFITAGNVGVNITVSVSLDSFRITDANDGNSADHLSAPILRISMVGGLGNDRLAINSDVDRPVTLNGGKGDDTLVGGLRADSLIGGLGNDTVDYSLRTTKLTVILDDAANDGASGENDNVSAETIIGGSANDVITGSDAAESFLGNGGKDMLTGLGGNDTLSGGNKNDLLIGGAGADSLVGGAGTLDFADYSSRTAAVSLTLDGLANDGESGEGDTITGTVEVLVGGSGNDTLVASGKPNSLLGNAGNDTLRGGGGNDTIDGGTGTDSMLGEGGADRFFADDDFIDTINGGSGSDLAGAVDKDDVISNVP